MANNRTTTSANCVLLITVQNLFATPQRIEGYGPDDMISTDPRENIERVMGADGRFSFGWTPRETMMSLTIQADSLSNDFLERLQSAQEAAREVYVCDALYILPAIGKKYQCSRGALISYPPFPSARRTLQTRVARFEWERVTPALT
jgi:hypothetical protein